MRVLAIDSSGLTATVAIMEEEQTVAEYTVNYKKTHSQTLLPMIDEIVKMVNEDLGEVDAIAIAGGPGSFTGLRIGSATAKGLGLALGKPLIHVPTVDAMAYSVYGCEDIICPIMDARRKQVYTGIYSFIPEPADNTPHLNYEFQILCEQKAVPVEELIRRLNIYGRRVVFLGDGVPVYRNMLTEGLEVPFWFAPSFMNRQRASAVGALGIEYYKKGIFESAAEHRPDYLRMSQAERERAEKEKNSVVEVRKMTMEDSAAVAEMEHQIFSDAWSEKSVLETIRQPNGVCLMAEKAGRAAGYLLAYTAADEVEITRVATVKEMRRQGVGKALLSELENLCRARGLKKILLEVRSGNTPARELYTAYGFREDGVRQKYYTNPLEDAVLMSLQAVEELPARKL